MDTFSVSNPPVDTLTAKIADVYPSLEKPIVV